MKVIAHLDLAKWILILIKKKNANSNHQKNGKFTNFEIKFSPIVTGIPPHGSIKMLFFLLWVLSEDEKLIKENKIKEFFWGVRKRKFVEKLETDTRRKGKSNQPKNKRTLDETGNTEQRR